MSPSRDAPPPSIDDQRKRIAEAERTGAIDPATNLMRHRVWLFSGASDRTVASQVVDALAGFCGAHAGAANIFWLFGNWRQNSGSGSGATGRREPGSFLRGPAGCSGP